MTVARCMLACVSGPTHFCDGNTLAGNHIIREVQTSCFRCCKSLEHAAMQVQHWHPLSDIYATRCCHVPAFYWQRVCFVPQDVDELGMADLELPVLGDLLIEQGAQLAPSATVSPPMWADLEQRWAGSFHADSEELSEPSTGTALRHTLAQAGTRRAGNHKSGIPDLQPTVLRNACTTAPPSHSSICHQTAQFSEYAGRADLPLPVLAVGAAIARPSGESAAAQGSPASLMPGIDGPDPAPHGCVATRAAR